MITAVADTKEANIEQLETLAGELNQDGPAWLTELRTRAIARFVELGFPTGRHEQWRGTSVAPIARTAFDLPGKAVELDAGALQSFTVPGLGPPHLVFVNGRYAPHLSALDELPDGVKVLRLADAIAQGEELVTKHLGRTDSDDDAFSALNRAFIEDGVFVHAEREAVIEQPIQILSVATGSDRPVMTHPRNLIVADDHSRLTVIEHYVSSADDVYLTNAVTEVIAGAGSHVSHYLIERESPAAYNISTLHSRQGRDSRFDSHTILLGGKLVRNNVHPVMDGESAVCLVNGLYVGRGEQHMDNHMRVEHQQPHGDSRQFYRGILQDQAHGVFTGRIYVAKAAQKTDAKQSNANLLLSDTAQADAKPQLEIYADDVKCTHGATTGRIDESGVFYLRSRGIDETEARAMMVHAFAAESLVRMEIDPIRTWLDGQIIELLPHTQRAEALIES